jgi:hypothetical protein
MKKKQKEIRFVEASAKIAKGKNRDFGVKLVVPSDLETRAFLVSPTFFYSPHSYHFLHQTSPKSISNTIFPIFLCAFACFLRIREVDTKVDQFLHYCNFFDLRLFVSCKRFAIHEPLEIAFSDVLMSLPFRPQNDGK